MGVRHWLAAASILLVACGRVPPPGSVEVPTAAPTTAAAAFDVAPEDVHWLLPAVDPPGLRSGAIWRGHTGDCAAATKCAAPPFAALIYTAEPDDDRSLRIEQSVGQPTSPEPDPLDTAPERAVGDRVARVLELDSGVIRVGWIEPSGIAARVEARGLPWDVVAAVIAGMRPADPSAWPASAGPPPVPTCLPVAQIAPMLVPHGWQRFVIQAQPADVCAQGLYLMMSVVRPPGPGEDHGTLVTIVTSAAAQGPMPDGEPLEVNGRTGALRTSQVNREPYAQLAVVIDDVLVDAHGNTDPELLIEIVASVRVLDDAEWAALVAAIERPA